MIARLLLTALLAFGAIAIAGAQAPTPYTIDVIISLTGPAAFAGKTEADALRLYEPIANRQGGIRGRPVHFELDDDQSSPQIALQLANTVLDKHPAIVMGCTFVPACSAIAPLFASGPVLYAFSPGWHPTSGGYVFAPIYPVEYAAAAQLRYFADKGLTRIAIISSTDASGQENDRATQTALKLPDLKSLKVVAVEHFTPTDISVAAQISHIKAADPQALFVWASGTPFGTVLHGLADAALDIPVMTTAANMIPGQLAGYGSALPRELLFGGQSYLDANRRPGDPLKSAVDEFTNAFAAAGIKPTVVAGLAWDPAKITVAALRQVGPDATGAQLHAFLENLHGFVGAGGVYDFRTGDQHGLNQQAVILVRWNVARGTYAVVSRQGGAPL